MSRYNILRLIVLAIANTYLTGFAVSLLVGCSAIWFTIPTFLFLIIWAAGVWVYAFVKIMEDKLPDLHK